MVFLTTKVKYKKHHIELIKKVSTILNITVKSFEKAGLTVFTYCNQFIIEAKIDKSFISFISKLLS